MDESTTKDIYSYIFKSLFGDLKIEFLLPENETQNLQKKEFSTFVAFSSNLFLLLREVIKNFISKTQ
jgi:hypothetical protein